MGKKTVITVVVIIALAIALVVSWLLGLKNAVYVIVGLILVVFIYSMTSIDKTLQKYPELALMDGTEYVTYKQAEMASKKVSFILETLPVSDPDPPLPPPNLGALTDGEES